jgi:class 3 adenylate cyclase
MRPHSPPRDPISPFHAARFPFLQICAVTTQHDIRTMSEKSDNNREKEKGVKPSGEASKGATAAVPPKFPRVEPPNAFKLYELLRSSAPLADPYQTLLSAASNLSGVTSPFKLFSQDPEVQALKKEILDLQAAVSKQAYQLKTEKADKAHKDAQLQKLNETLLELQKKQELDFLLSRVTPIAEKAILGAPNLRDEFFASKEQLAFVVSIDIRRSTELMLKARTPSHFASFMTQFCADLETAIKDEFGVFDKFTGDGILAFFPEFFSGKDAGYHALTAAQKALAIFAEAYRRYRSSFTTVLRDVHLAVGIDFGGVHLVQVAGGLTVVGGAVVYACRLSGGPPGTILLDQPAYEKISDAYGGLCLMSETSIDIKHEGGVVCYELKPSNKPFNPAAPAWLAKADAKRQSAPAHSQSK